jgi:hypothetical protein
LAARPLLLRGSSQTELTSPLVAADVESAKHDWADAHRRLAEVATDPARAENLRLQLVAVTDELRRRVGGTFTLAELAAEYQRADGWAREAVAEQAVAPGWPSSLAVVEGAAFHLYSRGAVDYSP